MLTLVLDDLRLLAVEAGDTRGLALGVAVDIGTTTIALYLCELDGGTVLDSSAMTNSQVAYGADVMSRVSFAQERPGGRERLTALVRSDLARLAGKVCARQAVEPGCIYRWTLCGNTTMQHLLLGLDPAPLGRAPYLPLVNGAVEFSPAALGLPAALLAAGEFLPTVAGHVGADTVAVALAARLDQAEAPVLAVDLGTNGEIVLAARGRLFCCSTAAGPAFEGARIAQGMRAEPGAIDRCAIREDGTVALHVIGDTASRGICGSGLMEIVSELRRLAVVDVGGRILPPGELPPAARPLAGRLLPGDHGQYGFCLSGAPGREDDHRVALTQRDVRELQLAAGAISSGIAVLLRLAGDRPGGGRGGAAHRRVRPLPHAPQRAGGGPGARYPAGAHPLVSAMPPDWRTFGPGLRSGGQRACGIAARMEFVELAASPEWQEEFTESMFFPGPVG